MAHSSPSPVLNAEQLIAAVLAPRPRIAVFDCDGTLWSGDAGADFLYWEVERGLLPKKVVDWVLPRYRDYKAGNVAEDVMCGEMVQIHEGLSVAELQRAGEQFFVEAVEARIFPEMVELTARLKEIRCEMWAVSSTNEWLVRAGAKRFGIPGDRVLAACVQCRDGRATRDLIQVPTDAAKVTVLKQVVVRTPDVVFGNSMHDLPMMELGRAAYAIAPNPDLEEAARARGWVVYWPKKVDRE